ncbi:MAG: hypothetical protein RBS72_18720 [Sedimentisphaerales bacterium]|jgi:hypothetical protein|nr:hypothetical protein [Sedimentisphaerales bacterium]HNY79728.1 hypothetical protein [Sedimentisphaerales bacterium]HOC64765.1 hypothetical protein [Sedimentisphaerales bacterium]HOH65717.1 hypothetical protein [Sedimentisphaerales bacterium]HPY50518.1 hypothetical protein [Sedimentisphaerales bacterium]
MRNALVIGTLIGLALTGSLGAQDSVGEVTHMEFQAVNAPGESTYTATEKVTLEGIALHNPADMLDPTPDDGLTQMYNVAAEWQVFFQGEGDDHAGTAVWMGQMYNNLPWVSPDGGYSNEQWVAELTRLNAAQFSPGDRIRVTGYFLSYKGKTNVNEQHSDDPERDFTIELVEKGVGLPKPEVVTLNDLKDDQDRFIFDSARLVGGERYQSRLVKIEGVSVVDPNGWGPYGVLTITDGVKTLPVKLGRGNGIYAGSYNLDEVFDVIGILDQDSAALVDGYRLYVMNYDGNGHVLAAPEHRRADEIVAEPVEEQPVLEQ